WREDEFPSLVVHNEGRSRPQPPGARGPVPSEHPVVQADDELSIPAKGRIVRPPEYEAHRVAVATDQRNILSTGSLGHVADEDTPDLLDGYRYAFHRG